MFKGMVFGREKELVMQDANSDLVINTNAIRLLQKQA
jgi:hypothetical protein